MAKKSIRPLDPMEESTWRDLARFFVVLPRLLDDDLQRGARISLSEYTVLMNLSEAPEHQLRMTELATSAYLSGSRTTRIIDELAAEGFVSKARCPGDARGIDVRLTDRGLERLRDAYAVHLESVRSRVLDHVRPGALPSFGRTMAAIVRTLS